MPTSLQGDGHHTTSHLRTIPNRCVFLKKKDFFVTGRLGFALIEQKAKQKRKIMKKIILLLLLAIIVIGGKAQTLEEFVEKFSNLADAEVIHLDKEQLQAMFTQSLSQLSEGVDSAKTEKMRWVAEHVEEVTVISFESCSESDRKSYCDAIEQFEAEGLDKLVDVNEDGERVKILGKIEENYIHDLVVMAGEEKDPAFVRVKGEIDLTKFGDMQGNLVNINGITFP